MTPEKLRYYHAQAAKLDLRRKWQWMATWPLVYRYGGTVEMVFEYPCLDYRVDIYIVGPAEFGSGQRQVARAWRAGIA